MVYNGAKLQIMGKMAKMPSECQKLTKNSKIFYYKKLQKNGKQMAKIPKKCHKYAKN